MVILEKDIQNYIKKYFIKIIPLFLDLEDNISINNYFELHINNLIKEIKENLVIVDLKEEYFSYAYNRSFR
jgi:hypothetical protein